MNPHHFPRLADAGRATDRTDEVAVDQLRVGSDSQPRSVGAEPGSHSQRELVMARWGMPSPPKFVTGIDRGVTNIRNVASPHWRGWLKPENRCLVPATSFCEYTDKTPKVPTWFALQRPLPDDALHIVMRGEKEDVAA